MSPRLSLGGNKRLVSECFHVHLQIQSLPGIMHPGCMIRLDNVHITRMTTLFMFISLLLLTSNVVHGAKHASPAKSVTEQIREGYIPRLSNYSFEAMNVPLALYQMMIKRIVAIVIQEYITLGMGSLGMDIFVSHLARHIRMFLPGSDVSLQRSSIPAHYFDVIFRKDGMEIPYGTVLQDTSHGNCRELMILKYGTTPQKLAPKQRRLIEPFTYPNRPVFKHRRFVSRSTGIYYAAVGKEIPSKRERINFMEQHLLDFLSVAAFMLSGSLSASTGSVSFRDVAMLGKEHVYTEFHRTRLAKDARVTVSAFVPLRTGTIVAYDKDNLYIVAAPILLLNTNCSNLEYIAIKHVDEPRTDRIDLINRLPHTDRRFQQTQ